MNKIITTQELLQLMPFLLMLAGPVILLVIIAIKRNHLFSWFFTLMTFAGVLVTVIANFQQLPLNIAMLTVDKFSLLYTGIFAIVGIVITLLSHNYLEKTSDHKEEFYLLLVFATLGSSLMVASNDFVSLFLSLEVLSVSLYSMIAYLRNQDRAIEAGLKYLVLAAMSSAVLLFGIALVYFETGALSYAAIGAKLGKTGFTPYLVAGFAMIIAGAGFKMSVVPFHWWTSDVYQGANSPVTSFIATVSKGGMVGAMIRMFTIIPGLENNAVVLVLTIIAAASMFLGNILALQQTNLKRLLAYSSIAHLGYILIAFISFGNGGTQAATFYLLAYFATTLGAFGIIAFLSTSEGEAENISFYKGLYWRKPALAAFMTLVMFSLAGIPLTSGFVGKFFVATSGVKADLWVLLFFLAINSVIGVYYYLRVVVMMFSNKDNQVETIVCRKGVSAGMIALVFVAVMILYLGVYPSGIMELIQKSAIN
ncbi:MAG: NADH-quinone oxidoreductase subunit N [Bacteroidales bacterium]|nr:NADH-quinone oxidoreductase subunit N [Bacteroidales bacterium]